MTSFQDHAEVTESFERSTFFLICKVLNNTYGLWNQFTLVMHRARIDWLKLASILTFHEVDIQRFQIFNHFPHPFENRYQD